MAYLLAAFRDLFIGLTVTAAAGWFSFLSSHTFAQSTPSRSGWPDPIANDVVPYQTSALSHGPMLGRPTATSLRVWVRTKEPASFRVVYGTKLPLTLDSPSVSGQTDASQDNTGVADLIGLCPGTRYYYGIVTGGYLTDTRLDFDKPWPSFRTLPDATSFFDPLNNPRGLFNFSFSIGCGMRQRAPDGNFGIYANPPSFGNLFKRNADDLAFHIVNGDYTYEDVLDGTRAGYAANYRLYLTRGRNVANFFRYVPALFTYDDHEANSNLDGSGEPGLGDGDYLHRDDALFAWQQYAGWANDPSPYKGAIRFGRAAVKKGSNVLVDPDADFRTLKPEQVSTIHVGHYVGKRKKEDRAARGGPNIGVYELVEVIDTHRLRVHPAFRADGVAPYSIGTHHYFERRVANCHFFFLDTRGERAKFLGSKHAHDPDRFILGSTQRQWLLRGVTNTDADFVFIISTIPWTIYHSAYHVHPARGTASKGDGFCGYVHERELILPVLDKLEKPVLIFTGDVHNSIVVQITDNVWEMMCGPLNSSGHPAGTAGLPPFGGWFDSEGRTVKIKWMGGFPDNVHYKRNRSTYYTVVRVNNVLAAARPQDAGYQWISYDAPQVIVQYYDGYTGKLVYAEGISTVDAKSDHTPAPKMSRWPVKKSTDGK